MPKVTIITPCYNAAPYIANTIASVQRQSLTDWQYIIVDDGSTDKSYDIVADLAKSDSRITLLQQANQGSAAARNYALQYAKGQYIQFLDADDTIAPNKLQYQVTLMDQKHLDVTYTDWCMVDMDNQRYPVRGFKCSLIRILTAWGTFGTLPLHSFMYRRAFLDDHNINIPTHIKEREDWDFHIEVFSANPKHQRLPNFCGAMYTKSPTGKTTGASVDKIQLGTFRYLLFKISTTNGLTKTLLYLRFSIELCFWILRKIKYQNKQSLSSYCHHLQFKKIHTIGILLLPISTIIAIISIIRSHIQVH
jgi:glycosyltransferase involved in cell wall biosynthesis